MNNRLIRHILANGNINDWDKLAKLFDIKSGKVAEQIWKDFLTKGPNSGTTEESKFPQNMRVKKVWVTPQGKIGTSYEIDNGYGVNSDSMLAIAKVLTKKWKATKKSKASGIDVLVVSDLHAGAVVKALDDVIKTQEFNVGILEEYLGQIVTEVNSRNNKEVHVIIPGDIIETFTAFNHKDTWKNVSSYQGEVIILIYELLTRFLEQIDNLHTVYMVEGNHDRMTSDKQGNNRKGIVQVVSHFINKNSNINVEYHPFLLSKEIDGINYIVTHGDLKAQGQYNKFLFKYGKQGMFNVILSGHLHNFQVKESDIDFAHYIMPSLFTGNFFSEALSYNNEPAYMFFKKHNKSVKFEYLPCNYS